jgi:hypothetical protein
MTRKPVLKWNVPPGRLSRPIPRFLYRVAAPWRWFRRTIAHTVVSEVCRMPFRILATCRTPSLYRGIPLPSDPRALPFSIAFELACNEGIQTLMKEKARRGPLDLQTYIQGFHDGAKYVCDSSCIQSSNESMASRQE